MCVNSKKAKNSDTRRIPKTHKEKLLDAFIAPLISRFSVCREFKFWVSKRELGSWNYNTVFFNKGGNGRSCFQRCYTGLFK